MDSPPRTPSPALSWPKTERFEEVEEFCEYAEQYRPGGYHPVNLGDTFQSGRYKVIRKLGEGADSTVWLVASASGPKYAALKIIMAKSSLNSTETAILARLSESSPGDPNALHVTVLLDSFQHEGPNGTHQCLVFEIMGDSAATLIDSMPRKMLNMRGASLKYPKAMAKKILLHALQGLAFVHKNGIVHGDLQPGNMLFSIRKIDDIDEQHLKQDEAETAVSVQRIDRKVDKWAPSKMYTRQSLQEYVELDAGLCVKLGDFGAAFYTTSPPNKTETPIALRAPELILDQPFASGVDIWSYGCLVYELMTGEELFPIMLFSRNQQELDAANDKHLCQFNDIIAPLPNFLLSAWPRSSKWFDADQKRLKPSKKGDEGGDGKDTAACYEGKLEVEGRGQYVDSALEQRFAAVRHPDIDEEEATVICQLIRRILAYDPAERPSAEELLKHPWFAE